MNQKARKELSGAVAWAAAMIALAFAAAYAHRQGYIDDDMKVRVIAMNGLWIAWYGNRIPKAFVPSACARAAKRFIGWSMVLSGLVYAGVLALVPMPLALTFGTGAVLTGILVSLGYSLSLAAKADSA